MFKVKKTFNNKIVYERNIWPFNLDSNFFILYSLFGAVKLVKNYDPDKYYYYYGYGTGFDGCGAYLLPDKSWFGKNVIIFGVANSSSVHTDHRKKDILIQGKVPTNGLDDITVTVEAEYYTNFSDQQWKFCLLYTIMEVTDFCLLIEYKSISSK